MKKSKIDMRDAFFKDLYALAKEDSRVVLLSDDFGAPSLDKFRTDLPSQYFNIGISEQNMVSVAAGLSLSNKIVYIYAIAPFVTLRCYEQIKIDICNMNLPVTALGVGAGYGYSTAGPTHHAIEDIAIMRVLPNMTILSPSDSVMAAAFAKLSYDTLGPKYIRFDRGKLPLIYDNRDDNFLNGLATIKEGHDLCIITTGIMVHRAIEVAEELARYSINAAVVDIYRLKPVNEKLLLEIIREIDKLVTLEEHLISAGIGSIIAEILADTCTLKPLKRIGIRDERCFNYGNREFLQISCGLDVNSVTQTILNWMK
jgi:transketolase